MYPSVVGMITIVSYDQPLQGYLECNGQFVSKTEYSVLFKVIGNSFGETDTTFALPNLHGRVPIQADSKSPLGAHQGSETVSLQEQHLPPHTHQVTVTEAVANQADPTDHYLASGSARGVKFYAPGSAKRVVNTEIIRNTGMAQAHLNMQPYLSLRYVIATGSLDITKCMGSANMFAFDFVPHGYMPCNGIAVAVQQHQALYNLLGIKFGEGKGAFKLPDLRGRVPVGSGGTDSAYPLASKAGLEKVGLEAEQLPPHSHSVSMAMEEGTLIGGGDNILAGLAPIQSNQSADSALSFNAMSSIENEQHENMMPFLAINFCIMASGLYPNIGSSEPTRNPPVEVEMPLLGEIVLYAGKSTVPPSSSLLLCDGRLLKKADYAGLFSLLGNKYGPGDSEHFALPDMRGRVPMHFGQGPGLSDRVLGEIGGVEKVILNSKQLGGHHHKIRASTAPAVAGVLNGVLAAANIYSSSTAPNLIKLNSSSITTDPQRAAIGHENRQPSLALNFYISVYGVLPSRN